MKSVFLAGLVAATAFAQVSMNHVHLNVSDVDAQMKFWTTQFDAAPLPGGLGVQVRGMQILFNRQAPTHPNEGTGLDHFGFKVRNRDDMVARARAAGYQVGRIFTGSEGFPNAYLIAPDNMRVEVQEEASLPVRAVAQHLHFLVPEYWALRGWYADTFGMEPTTRGPHISTDIPGMNLTFATARMPNNKPTRGGVIDHVAFETANLTGLCLRLKIACSNGSGFLVDPNGVSIELLQSQGAGK